MTLLSAVLGSPEVAGTLEVLESGRDRPVSAVVLVEDTHCLGDAPEASIALFSTPLASHTTGYRLDVALRLAKSSGVAAVVLPAPKDRCPSMASRSLASRSNIWLLRAEPDVPLAALIIAIDRAIQGEAAEALHRLERLLGTLAECGSEDDIEQNLDRLSAAYGSCFQVADSSPGQEVVPAEPRNDEQLLVTVSSGDRGWDDISSRVATVLVQSTLVRCIEKSRRVATMPVLSAAEVLTELLANPKGDMAALLRRARTLGIPIDGWHTALRVEFETPVEPLDASAEVNAFAARQAVMRSALDHVRRRGGDWHLGRSGQAFLLIRMYKHDPGLHAVDDVADVARDFLAAVQSQFHDVELRCGVGTVHPGPPGLASTAMEARAAIVGARGAGSRDRVSKFDNAGLRRTLIEWYATDTARDAVRTVLQPLDSLGAAKRDTFILTLKTFLDFQGSLSRTAEALFLHRNAVSYRIKRIFDLLDIDPDNPDDRLLLQLACRAKAMQ